MLSGFPSAAALLIRFSAFAFLASAYAAWQARSSAKLAGVPIEPTFGIPLPGDVLLLTLGSATALLLGVIWSAGPLKASTWAAEMQRRSIDSEDSRVGFMSVRHRGGLLYAKQD